MTSERLAEIRRILGLCRSTSDNNLTVALLADLLAEVDLLSLRCSCKPAPRHVETCPQHDPERP